MARSSSRRSLTPEQAAAHLRACAATCRSDGGARVASAPVRAEHRRFDPPREPMLAGNGGLRLLTAIPGFVDLWDREVPQRALPCGLEAIVCECGAGSALEVGVQACPGGCGRWFLRLADAVLVRRFADELAAA